MGFNLAFKGLIDILSR